MFRENLKMSWKNIISDKMRSFLTTLGILIGVGAIISLVTLMEGAISETNKQFEDLGAGKISVSIHGTPLKAGLSNKDIDKLSKLENVYSVSPNISTVMDIASNSSIIEDVSIDGKTQSYFKDNKKYIVRGRGINILDINSNNNVCVIDKKLEQKAFAGKNSIGESIVISGISYKIIGVIDDPNKDVMASMMMGPKSEGTVNISYKKVMNLMETGNITSLEVAVKDTTKTNNTVSKVENLLDDLFNEDDTAYTVINMESILEVMEIMQNMMKGILVGIASISLLVGGIGISNMMIVNVSQRTTEIGLRKALGAQPKHIQAQFIIEATMLSVIGGILGVILGLTISLIGFSLLNIAPVISLDAIVLGVGFSALIGIVFGWAPAKKASELNPIDALRSL